MSTLKILSGGAMKSLMVEASPLFERQSGIEVETKFALTSVLQKEIEAGAAFDIALLPRPELDALAKMGKIAAKRDELIAKEKAKSEAERALAAPAEGSAVRTGERRRRRTEAAAE